jgi:hypothetical protein
MVEQRGGQRLAAALWFVAAVLAWTAVVIRYVRGGDLEWKLIAAGLFCAAMGANSFFRSR